MFCNFEFYGKIICLKSSNKLALQKIKQFWRAFCCNRSPKSPDVVFEISKFPQSQFRLFKNQYFSNPEFLFILDRQSLITCYFSQKPWHVYIQYFDKTVNPDLQSDHLAFGVFSLILRSVLKRLGFFQLHSAAVTNEKYGILIPGTMGSGKTTTALMMLKENFKLVADDQVFLKKNSSSIEVLGFARDLFVTKKTISFFPELSSLKYASLIRKGKRLKKVMSQKQFLKFFQNRMAQKTKVNYIFFPRLSKNAKTKIQRISKLNALAQLLNVESQERYRILIKDDFSLRAQLEIFSDLCEKAKSYDLLIARNDRNVAKHILKTIAAENRR